MQKEILHELKALKSLLAHLIGTPDLPEDQKFSIEALIKAAKDFQKLSIERGEWIAEQDIDKCIRNAPYLAGNFIRQEFSFANYFKRGRTHYYNKKDLLALAAALKDRNIDFKRYIELKEDQNKFLKYKETAAQNKEKKPAFKIPAGLKDIQTTPPKMPAPDLVHEEIKRLKAEFFNNKYVEYIDIYKGNYALIKHIYFIEKYIEPKLRSRVRKWCDDFNDANHLLEQIAKKKEIFVPIPETEMIQL